MKRLKISYIDLAVIIESIYYGGDEDVSDTEDLLKYLRNNGHLSTVLTVSRGLAMNKQELIDILENLECSTESLSYDNGYEQGVYDSLSHVILLDEPKKSWCRSSWRIL